MRNGGFHSVSRSVPDYAGVRGSATNTATVTVNGNTAWRLGEYFYGGDEASNAASAVMKELDITAVVNPPGTNEADLVQSVTGKVFVAKSPEAFTYDDDGNMLSDGRFNYTWDGENRLASIETSAAAASAGASRVRVEYSYDHRSRRIGKVISHGGVEAQSWTVAESRSFLYDNWNMIQEIKYSNIPSFHSSTNSYVWGLDLSGSMQGAGGVGGLLAVVKDGEAYHPAIDGNGNVCEYSSTDGTIVAHYEYSPFGETVVQSGDMADAFAFRFSTKYWENEPKLYYYGYRFYAPNIGRWLNRDPIGESGGCNLYVQCNNAAIWLWDGFGDTVNQEGVRSGVALPDEEFDRLYIMNRTNLPQTRVTDPRRVGGFSTVRMTAINKYGYDCPKGCERVLIREDTTLNGGRWWRVSPFTTRSGRSAEEHEEKHVEFVLTAASGYDSILHTVADGVCVLNECARKKFAYLVAVMNKADKWRFYNDNVLDYQDYSRDLITTEFTSEVLQSQRELEISKIKMNEAKSAMQQACMPPPQ